MDRGYEGIDTRQLALDLGFVPAVPPKSNRIEPWEYDRAMYKRLNAVERLFRRLKGFRRIFSRFEQRHVHWLYSLRPHHRGPSVVLTRPSHQSDQQSKSRTTNLIRVGGEFQISPEFAPLRIGRARAQQLTDTRNQWLQERPGQFEVPRQNLAAGVEELLAKIAGSN